MDYIMWLLIGILIYFAIGEIFIHLTGAYGDGFWVEFKIFCFWPILVIIYSICCIYFGWNELYKKILLRKRSKIWKR